VLPDSDEDLMLRAARDDAEAFSRLYDRWAKPLTRWLQHLCRDATLSEDLLHDTFLRLWRARHRYEVRARFSTYLFQIARNLWINHGTRTTRRGVPLSLDASVGGDDGASLSSLVAGNSPEPSRVAIRHETGRRIGEAVALLTDRQRDVFLLGAVQGLPYEEVAAILDIPEGTVKSRMWSAMRALRGHLEDLA
jgi:RNA polymerase sigma-70 factor (ECF subfamily)